MKIEWVTRIFLIEVNGLIFLHLTHGPRSAVLWCSGMRWHQGALPVDAYMYQICYANTISQWKMLRQDGDLRMELVLEWLANKEVNSLGDREIEWLGELIYEVREYEILFLNGQWTATIEVWDAWLQDQVALKFKLVSNHNRGPCEDAEPEAA